MLIWAQWHWNQLVWHHFASYLVHTTSVYPVLVPWLLMLGNTIRIYKLITENCSRVANCSLVWHLKRNGSGVGVIGFSSRKLSRNDGCSSYDPPGSSIWDRWFDSMIGRWILPMIQLLVDYETNKNYMVSWSPMVVIDYDPSIGT